MIMAALSARFLVIYCSLGMNNQYSIKYLVGRRMALNEKTVFSFRFLLVAMLECTLQERCNLHNTL